MKILSSIPPFFRNKYVVVTIAFVVWMLFFDRNDVFAGRERKAELTELQKSKQYYIEQINLERRFSEDLKNNPAAIEKVAREMYKMKRDNEDLFIVEPQEK